MKMRPGDSQSALRASIVTVPWRMVPVGFCAPGARL